MVIIPWLHPTAIVFTSVREEGGGEKQEGDVVKFYCASRRVTYIYIYGMRASERYTRAESFRE